MSTLFVNKLKAAVGSLINFDASVELPAGRSITGTDVASIYGSGQPITMLTSPAVGGGSSNSTTISLAVPAYANNKTNLRHIGTAYDLDVTTKVANSAFVINGAFQLSGNVTSHGYYDIYVQHDGVNKGWLSELAVGGHSANDGILANHRSATSDIYKEAINLRYEPNVAAGTVIKLQQYVGNWVAGTMVVGGYTATSNNNASSTANGFTITEITP